MTLDHLINELRLAPRQGTDTDEPEGSRYIIMSDTLALQVADLLETFKEPACSPIMNDEIIKIKQQLSNITAALYRLENRKESSHNG